jgi:hypothetical protein
MFGAESGETTVKNFASLRKNGLNKKIRSLFTGLIWNIALINLPSRLAFAAYRLGLSFQLLR